MSPTGGLQHKQNIFFGWVKKLEQRHKCVELKEELE
jgi:hypothetical protein